MNALRYSAEGHVTTYITPPYLFVK